MLACFWLAGCGRYTEFELPSPPGQGGCYRRLNLESQPVLARGAPGEWDSVDTLNPAIAKRGSNYFNCYSGFDGRVWRTGLATSEDGLRWRKYGSILSPDPQTWEGGYIAANGALVDTGNEFLYWYQAGPKGRPRIGLARSTDARIWRKHGAAVLGTGPRGAWDEVAVADPYVIRVGGAFYVFYLGQDRARRQRLGVARSPDGVDWEKLRTNPILELGDAGSFDESGLGEPAVWAAGGYYWMLYSGRDRAEQRRLGLARSRNGVTWRKMPLEMTGAAAWNTRVICDPEIELSVGGVRVWFGGGDRASPDENLSGQIGAGTLGQ